MPMFDFPLCYINATMNMLPVQILVDSACLFTTIDVNLWFQLHDKPPIKKFNCEVATFLCGILCVTLLGVWSRLYHLLVENISITFSRHFPNKMATSLSNFCGKCYHHIYLSRRQDIFQTKWSCLYHIFVENISIMSSRCLQNQTNIYFMCNIWACGHIFITF